jgi:hypothetical protein
MWGKLKRYNVAFTVVSRGDDPPYPPMSPRAALIAKNAIVSGPSARTNASRATNNPYPPMSANASRGTNNPYPEKLWLAFCSLAAWAFAVKLGCA